jgi:GR25 family glycosyltransferase involved in LPS biosynthesis
VTRWDRTAYLLNLDTRADRRTASLARCREVGLSPTVVSALTPERAREAGLWWSPWLNPAQAACAASHKQLYDRIGRDHRDLVLVLEDDVLFYPGFADALERTLAELPDRCGFVQLGWLPTAREWTLSYRARHRLGNMRAIRATARAMRPQVTPVQSVTIWAPPAFGTHCYLVSADLARALAGLIGPQLLAPIDLYLRFFFELMGVVDGPEFRRTRFPLAGQDWTLTSDIVHHSRFDDPVGQLDHRGRARVRPSPA